MPRTSAGLIAYRTVAGFIEVFLVHPGGPYWQNREAGAWSICKGELALEEDPLNAAIREFLEETAIEPRGPYIELTPVRQKGGKIVLAWAFNGTFDPSQVRSNTFLMEWPPDSGCRREFPEIDRAAFFRLETAKKLINPAQAALLEELEAKLTRC